MESELRVPEEHGSVQRDGDRDILSVEFLEYKKENSWNYKKYLLGLMWEFLYKVQQQDSSKVLEFNVLGGCVRIPEVEAELLRFMHEGAKVQIAIYKKEVIGYMIYHIACDCILFIRHLYVEPEFSKSGIAKKFVNSLDKDIKRVFFQTRKENPPKRLLEITSKYVKRVTEKEKIITWEMDWEK